MSWRHAVQWRERTGRLHRAHPDKSSGAPGGLESLGASPYQICEGQSLL